MPFQILRLKLAVERQHKCKAKHAGSRVIVETAPDGTIWRGKVEAFELTNHPAADRCYAWAEQRGTRTRCFTHLKIQPVRSAQTAVRVALASRSLEGKLPPPHSRTVPLSKGKSRQSATAP